MLQVSSNITLLKLIPSTEVCLDGLDNDGDGFFDECDATCNRNKDIIFTGLDADICLGSGKGNNYYDMKADYKYYINIDENIILKQKFLRQVDKLYERKEWFINTFLENKKNEKFIREKILRFVDISSWRKQMNKCNNLYRKRGYKFMSREDIYNDILKKLNYN